MFEPCPCGSGAPYLRCCAPLHLGQRDAATPEELMRARYTAFAREDAAFLLRSWAPETRPGLVEFAPGRTWRGLEIRDAPPADGDAGSVTFTARYALGGRAGAMTETSRFERRDGRWFYVDGAVSGAVSGSGG